MHGAVCPIPNIPSWGAQGQIVFEVEVESNVLNGALINCV
jgi:hypothetical protein